MNETILTEERSQAPLIREALPPLAPGRGLAALFAAPKDDFAKAISQRDHDPSSKGAGHALSSISSHLAASASAKCAPACRSLCHGLLDGVLDTSTKGMGGARGRAARVILCIAERGGMAWEGLGDAMRGILEGEERKMKLSIVTVARAMADASWDVGEAKVGGKKGGGAGGGGGGGEGGEGGGGRGGGGAGVDSAGRQQAQEGSILLDAASSLVNAMAACTCSDGADDGKGGRAPTLLTTQAAECCICICTALAQQCAELDGEHEGAVGVGTRGRTSKAAAAHRERRDGKDGEGGDGPLRALAQLSGSMSLVLREMGGWYAAKRPLLSQGLVAYSQILEACDRGGDGADQLVARLWCLAGKDMTMEDPEGSRVRSIVALLPVPSPDDRGDRDGGALYVFALACVLGRLKEARRTVILNSNAQALIPPLLEIIRAGWLESASIAARIAGMALCGAVSSQETLEALAPSLIGMLDSKDGAGEACAALLTELCISLPSEVVRDRIMTQIIKAASSGVAGSTKANAISVLSQVVTLSVEGRRIICDGGRLRRITGMLLDAISGGDLAVRREASRMFAVAQPDDVLPCLCRMLYDRDEKPRSAGEASLLSLLSGHEDPSSVVCGVINIARLPASSALSPAGGQTNTPKHPGEIASPPQSPPKGRADWPDRLIRVLSKWAAEAPRHIWRPCIPGVVSKLFGAPQDPVLVRVCSQLAGALSNEVDAVIPLIEARLKALNQAGKAFVASDDQATSQEMTFAQLSPLLLLKLLSTAALSRTSSSLECLSSLVSERAFGPTGGQQVKQVACEALGRLPPRLSQRHISQRLKPLLSRWGNGPPPERDAGAALFSLCFSLELYGGDADGLLNGIERAVFVAPEAGPEWHHIQEGCIACLSGAIGGAFRRAGAVDDAIAAERGDQVAKITEIVEEEQVQGGEVEAAKGNVDDDVANQVGFEALERLLAAVQVEGSGIGKRLRGVNVLIGVARALGATAGGGDNGGLRLLTRQVAPTLLEMASKTGESREAGPRAASLQALFVCMHGLSGNGGAIVPDTMAVALDALKDSDATVRLAALRLVGACAGGDEGAFTSDEGMLLRLRSALMGLCNMEPSSDVRSLAESLKSLIFPQE